MITSDLIIVKIYPIDLPDWSISVGIGAEHTKLAGSVSMGGFNFHTTGAGWSPVLQIGGLYHLSKRLSLGMDYQKSNVRIVTSIPGVPDLVSTYEGNWSARVVYELF